MWDIGYQIYFCGLMVFTKTDPSSLKVLDGQQRLATTLMIFSAIRNWLGAYSSDSSFKTFEVQIVDSFLGYREFGESIIQPKLTLNPTNNDLFNRYVIDAAPIADIQNGLSSRNKELYDTCTG